MKYRYRINEIKLELDESLETLPEKIKKKVGKKVSVSDVRPVRISIDSRKNKVIKVVSADFSSNQRCKLPTPIESRYEIPVVGVEAGALGDSASIDVAEAGGPARPAAGANTGPAGVAAAPLIVGFGPCGMFCALVLARAGLRPIIIERGQDVDQRTRAVEAFWKGGPLNPESNVQFGEGGAGTFSDGKLNTGIKDPRIRFVLETFVEAGADPYILLDARPHIGTDVLRTVVKNIREEIISLGGEIRFETRFEGFGPQSAAANPGEGFAPLIVKTSKGNIEAAEVVLAIGHSARDTVRMLYDSGFIMEPKSFSMGVRVEHPQELIDRGTYGDYAGHPELPPAYYKLSTRTVEGRGVYSFCMCPGGEIVNASSQEGGVVTNGMSNHARNSGFANSGILVDVRPEDYGNHPLGGIEFQEKYERLAFINGGSNYTLPETTWGEFRAAVDRAQAALSAATPAALSAATPAAQSAITPDGPPPIQTAAQSALAPTADEASASAASTAATPAPTSVNPVVDSLPVFVAEGIREAMPVFGTKIKGFDNEDTLIKAIESRSSSPVRIVRDKESLQATAVVYPGGEGARHTGETAVIYPGGEGAGYAGGITSAACDGIKIAEKIISARMQRIADSM